MSCSMTTMVMPRAATYFNKPHNYLTDVLATIETYGRLTIYAPDTGVPVEEADPVQAIHQRRACPHQIQNPLAGSSNREDRKGSLV